jgi:DUF1680 family protein
VVLDLAMAPTLVEADPRADAMRGCVAIERGPLVYCLEGVDHPGRGLDDIVVDTASPLSEEHRPDLLGGVVTVTAAGHRRALPEGGWWPYRTRTGTVGNGPSAPSAASGRLALTAVPYFAWANRRDGAMRVWIPTR